MVYLYRVVLHLPIKLKLTQIKSNVSFWGGEKTWVPGEKALRAEQRTNKLNAHMTPSLGIESGLHSWETSALTTEPVMLSLDNKR